MCLWKMIKIPFSDDIECHARLKKCIVQYYLTEHHPSVHIPYSNLENYSSLNNLLIAPKMQSLSLSSSCMKESLNLTSSNYSLAFPV